MATDRDYDYDVIVVGSGFGGSVTALRLAEKGYRVGVVEAGRRWDARTLPVTNWALRRFLWFPRLGMRGIQRLSLLDDVLVMSGAGVGGGSLVYANTLYEPLDPFFTDPQWGSITDWRAELAPHYAEARRMLGVTETPFETPADAVVYGVAERLGVAHTYHRAPVGVFFGRAGVEVPDPYFDGAGPSRAGCIRCGACMVGCRHNAKNTLDRNYLHLAERAGADVQSERQVVDLRPHPDGGWVVATERPGAWVRHRRRALSAGEVVLSAGVLGTLKLLFGLRSAGRLPHLSGRLGETVRTNSEAIVAAVARETDVDYSTGVAITSSVHPDAHTHIEPVRYPKGSNAMGLLGTLLVDGGGRLPRPLRFLGQAARRPGAFCRSLSLRHWSERTVILLCMQSRDNSLRVRMKAGFGRGRRRVAARNVRLTTGAGHGEPNPTYIPEANEAARLAAEIMDGDPCSSLNEVLLDVPTTAHVLGGCCIGATPEEGVIDPYHRVYGHPGLHVADGSAVSANLGVNPSLTITAMAERAMSFWPEKGAADPRPPLGSGYRRVEPATPRRPAVREAGGDGHSPKPASGSSSGKSATESRGLRRTERVRSPSSRPCRARTP